MKGNFKKVLYSLSLLVFVWAFLFMGVVLPLSFGYFIHFITGKNLSDSLDFLNACLLSTLLMCCLIIINSQLDKYWSKK